MSGFFYFFGFDQVAGGKSVRKGEKYLFTLHRRFCPETAHGAEQSFANGQLCGIISALRPDNTIKMSTDAPECLDYLSGFLHHPELLSLVSLARLERRHLGFRSRPSHFSVNRPSSLVEPGLPWRGHHLLCPV